MLNRRKFIQQSVLTASVISLAKSKALAKLTDNRGLKDYFENDFKMGVAVSSRIFEKNDTELQQLIKQEFSSISPENCLKWERVHPSENKWNWKVQDRYVNFGIQNNMHIQGHVLVWHSQVPKTLFIDKNGKQVSKIELTRRLDEHISTLVDRYKGKINSWDVVNEAITPKEHFRKTKWFEIMGPGFMEHAFRLAHNADPNCHLIYNDYGMNERKRREYVVEMIKDYKKRGVPIHGIGMQGHYNLDSPNIQAIEESIIAFAEQGMRVHFTELDVDVLPFNWGATAEVSTSIKYDKKLNPYVNGLPKEIEDKFTRRYEELFKLFIKHRDKIDRVTFWGTSDDYSWKNNFPVRGRTNYPLLFDRQHQRKPAWYAVTNLKSI